jgi:hypothetical protein
MQGTAFYVNNSGHVVWKDCGSKVTATQVQAMDHETRSHYGKLCLSTIPAEEELASRFQL